MTNQPATGQPAIDASRIQSMFLVQVHASNEGTFNEIVLSAAASLPLEQIRHKRLAEVINGLSSMQGLVPNRETYPSLIRYTLAPRMPATWTGISNVTIGATLSWPNVGVGKVVELIAFLALSVADAIGGALADGVIESGRAEAFDVGIDLLNSLRSIAAWGTVSGHPDLLSALNEASAGPIDSPSEAMSVIMSMDLAEFAGDRAVWWDRDLTADKLFGQFNDREIAVLEARVLTGTRQPTRTLEELGEQLGLTRQRIQQIELTAVAKLTDLISQDRYRSLRTAAEEVSAKVGAGCPAVVADAMIANDPDSLVDELLLWMAGPYHRSDGWILREEFPTVADLVMKGFEEVAEDSITTWESVLAVVTEEGLALSHFNAALSATTEITEYEEHLVRWPSTTAGRARMALSVRGIPMTSEELFTGEPKAMNIRSYRNSLHSSSDLVKVGLDRWGLIEWGEDEYPGVVPSMLEAIEERGPFNVNELAAELAERYGVSAASVSINASRHPVFLLEDGIVALRPKDQPYMPDTDLADTSGCFLVNGSWAYRMQVDRDVLRGSGRAIPEAFAVHLGIEPMISGRLDGPVKNVAVSWNQSPTIGSTRLNIAALGLVDGDMVFVRRTTANSLDFIGLHKSRLDASSRSGRAQLLVGADLGDERETHLVVAEALGMGLAVAPSLDAVDSRLRSRGDHEIADLLIPESSNLADDSSIDREIN